MSPARNTMKRLALRVRGTDMRSLARAPANKGLLRLWTDKKFQKSISSLTADLASASAAKATATKQNGASSFPLCGLVTEQCLAFFSEKIADDGDAVITFRQDEPAGDEASAPLVLFRPALAAISGNIFLGDAVDDRANSSPHAGAGAHGARFVRRVENEVGQVAAITAGYVFERFQLDVFDA